MGHKCNFCGLYFSGLPVFYRHRVGEGSSRQCLDAPGLFSAGLRLGQDYAYHAYPRKATLEDLEAPRISVQNQRTPRKGIEIAPPLPIQESSARWCFERGVSPDRLIQAGLPAATVANAVEAELTRITGVGTPAPAVKKVSFEPIAVTAEVLIVWCQLSHKFRMEGDSWAVVADRLEVSVPLARAMVTLGSKGRKLRETDLAAVDLLTRYTQEQAARR